MKNIKNPLKQVEVSASAPQLINYIKNIPSASHFSKKYLILVANVVLIRLLGEFYGYYTDGGLYYDLVSKLVERVLFKLIESYGDQRLVAHLQDKMIMSQPTESRCQVALVIDKTNDGTRFGKKQLRAHKQYAGGHSYPIHTHGWFFLVAVLGTEKRPEIVWLRAEMYRKGKSQAEWEEGLRMLESVGRVLDTHGILRDSVTAVVDHGYINETSKVELDNKGWIFVGKEGGTKIKTLQGVTTSMAKHARRRWKNYQTLDEIFREKAKVESYARTSSDDGFIYFQGRFPQKYEHWAYRYRFVVTNKPKATGQWVYQRYNQRWVIETYFRTLKQSFGWRDYHPQTSGNRYLVHTACVILSYAYISELKRTTKGLGVYTIGKIRKMCAKQWLEKKWKYRIQQAPTED